MRYECLEGVRQVIHHKIDLVAFAVTLFLALLEDGHENHVEILLGLGGGFLIGTSHKDVAVTGNLVAAPLQFVLVNVEAGTVRIAGLAQNFYKEAEE